VPRVTVRGPTGQVECTLELEKAMGTVLGRAPDVESVRWLAEDGERLLGTRIVVVPSVSANHVVVWDDGTGICIRDLGSRNGSWILLPKERTVRTGVSELVLQLAQATNDGPSAEEPPQPVWATRREFARAVADAISSWMKLQGMDACVKLVSRQNALDGVPAHVPLATGEALSIIPTSTATASWARLLERLWRWVGQQNLVFQAEEQTREEGMILASAAIRAAHREVVSAARVGACTLLVTGASGSGKEMLAEVFHRHSGRNGPFIAVNCSMFGKELLRSELFGAQAGSFTGATRRIIGAVERAEGGTLFLDEIGEMSSEVQPMLLRFLDRREYESLGQYGKVQRADVAVVAATNQDLRDEARAGRFRVDLWYRLSVHIVEVPALRNRLDDIEAYLASVQMDDQTHSLRDALAPAAMDVLRAHSWDGNFRELTNLVQRLPRDALPGSIDAHTCRRALESGSLHPVSGPASVAPAGAGETDWAELARHALAAFAEDHGHLPRSWNDQKEWNEKYLKPLLFFELSGSPVPPAPADDGALTTLASRAATRVQADRGTAAKQLARYFERFRA